MIDSKTKIVKIVVRLRLLDIEMICFGYKKMEILGFEGE